ncbi:MAG: hypothetical protein IT457_16910 [Planctomycetes bacterium]|nr:hypothetical protein [Planctomycetota bacterium]
MNHRSARSALRQGILGTLGLAALAAGAARLIAQEHWLRQHPGQQPAARGNFGLAFDAARGEMLLFGGAADGGNLKLGDTWVWNGVSWSQRFPVHAPAPRNVHGMAYDSRRQRVVLFGGVGYGATYGDTWEWDGVDWTRRSSANAPSPRAAMALAHDTARSRLVLFGGVGASGVLLGDTWEWDGVDWTQRSPQHAPSARYHAGAAFQSHRNRVVLFAGIDSSSTPLADTWEWDGVDWFRRSPVPAPPARLAVALAYDPLRGRTLLFGGQGRLGAGPLGDTWEWDGNAWFSVDSLPSPAPRLYARYAYDPLRAEVLLFGGNLTVGPIESDETWVHGVGPTFRSFGGGCAGGAGFATLSAHGAVPRLGQSFTVFASNLPPDHAALMFLGVSNRTWQGFSLPLQLDAFGMPGCRLFVSTELASPLFNWSGQATWMALIPNDMSLAGRSFYLQALAIDRVANPLGAVMSNAMAGVIGG